MQLAAGAQSADLTLLRRATQMHSVGILSCTVKRMRTIVKFFVGAFVPTLLEFQKISTSKTQTVTI
jgi:hypothetical protein